MTASARLLPSLGRLRYWQLQYLGLALLCLAALASLLFWLPPGGSFYALTVGGCTVIVALGGGYYLSQRMLNALLAQVAGAIELGTGQAEPADGAPTGWAPHDRILQLLEAWRIQYRSESETQQKATAYYHMLASEAPGLELFFDAAGALQWMNRGAEQFIAMYQNSISSLEALIEHWVYVKDRPLLRDYVSKAWQGQAGDPWEGRLIQGDGHLIWYLCRLHRSSDGSGLRFSAQIMQRRKDAELKLLETVAALQRAQALKEHYLNRSNDEKMRLTVLLDIVAFGILFVDHDRRVTYMNRAALQMWRLDGLERVVGMRDDALMELTAAQRIDDPAYRAHVAEMVASDRRSDPYDIYCCDGRVIREQSAPMLSANEPQPIGRVWIFEDVTESLRMQQRLATMAECDPLTGLLNRRRFNEELNRLLADTARRGAKLALVVTDIRGFRDVCDRYGHQAGDEVLMGLADVLSALIRRNEFFFRLEGDEFALLLPYTQRSSVEALAQRLAEQVAAHAFHFAGQEVFVALNLGIAFAPDHGLNAESILFEADQALSAAKRGGASAWRIARVPNDGSLTPG